MAFSIRVKTKDAILYNYGVLSEQSRRFNIDGKEKCLANYVRMEQQSYMIYGLVLN